MQIDNQRISPTPHLRSSVFGACVLLAVAAGLTASVPVAAGETTVPPSPAATSILTAAEPAEEPVDERAAAATVEAVAVPVDAVLGEEPPAPPADDQHLLERHAPDGAVLHLDDEGLLVAPAGAADTNRIRAATCTRERPDYQRVTADRSEASVASRSSADAVLAIMGCDVTGFRIEVDGRTVDAVVGAADRDAEQRLLAAAAALPEDITVRVVLDETRYG